MHGPSFSPHPAFGQTIICLNPGAHHIGWHYSHHAQYVRTSFLHVVLVVLDVASMYHLIVSVALVLERRSLFIGRLFHRFSRGMSDTEEDWTVADRPPGAAAEGGSTPHGGTSTPKHETGSPRSLGPLGAQEDSSGEEDWVAGGAAAPCSEVVSVGAPAAEAPSAMDPEPTYRIVTGRLRKRPAGVRAGMALAAAPCDAMVAKSAASGSGTMGTSVGTLASLMYGPRTPGSRESLLMSHSALAEQCGIPMSSMQRELRGLAHSAYTTLKQNLVGFVSKVTSSMGFVGEGSQRSLLQPLLFVRWRKYDETPLKLSVPVARQQAESSEIIESTTGTQKLLVTEAGWAMCVRQIRGEESQILAVAGDHPTILQVIEKNSAECLNTALKKQLEMSYDGLVDTTFFSAASMWP